MNTKDFIARQLGTAGWAPIDHGAAKFLAPEVASQHHAFAVWQSTPSALLRLFPHTSLFSVKVDGLGRVLVLARNGRFLDERMTWLGFPASDVVEAGIDAAPLVTVAKAAPHKFADERLARLKDLAKRELPNHGCTLRQDILAARNELAELDSVAA